MSSGSTSVLVVEDEPAVRALVQDLLTGEGYTVFDAGDPWEALGVAETRAIGLLVTDVVMPDMSGRELARRIESIQPDTKVLFMSASAVDDLLEPDAHFIAKPFPLAHMVRTVHAVLTDRGPTGSARLDEPPAWPQRLLTGAGGRA
jgi:CheY-like chemotaxis protein